MSEWKKCLLGSLGKTFSGLSGKSGEDFGKGEKYIPYMNIFSSARIDPNFLEHVRIELGENQNKVKYGDIFFTTSSETVEEVGMTSVLLDELDKTYLNSFCFGFRLRNFDQLLPEFAAYLLRSQKCRKLISITGRGSTRYNLPKTILFRKLELDLPPLPEQRKIACILTTVDNLIEKTEALIEKYKAIKQGMMHDLFTRGVDSNGKLRPPYEEAPHLYKESELGWIPKEWEVAAFGDEIEPISSGWSPLCDAVSATKDQWAILKTTAVVWKGYDEGKNKRLPSELLPNPAIEVQKDDILITRKGPVERVGVVIHVPETRPKLMFPDTVFRVRIKKESDLIPAFVPFALGSDVVQTDWFGRKIGLADAQVNINHGILKTTNICKPKLNEQQAIVWRLLSVQNRILSEENQLEVLASIKQGLMQDLLTGKVRVKVDEVEEVTANV